MLHDFCANFAPGDAGQSRMGAKSEQTYREVSKMDQEKKQSAIQLGKYRASQVCCWIRRCGTSNAANIAKVAGVNRVRYADELVQRGYLKKIRMEPGHADRYVYILSDIGRQRADFELEDWFGDSLPNRPSYTYTEHQHVPQKNHEHDMVAQEILLRLAGDELDYFELWSTEWEERHNQGEASSADATDNFVETEGEHARNFIRLHEVELNQKTNARLRHWLGLRIQRLSEYGEGRACCCIWASTSGVIEAYKAELSTTLPRYYRTKTGALAIDQSEPNVQAEPWMFRFFRLKRDERGLWHPRDEDVAKLRG